MQVQNIKFVLQLVFLNMGLAKFEALQYIPAFTVLYILMGTMVGLIFYEEYRSMDSLSWGLFSLGLGFIVAALVILGQKKPHHTDTINTHTTSPDRGRRKPWSHTEQLTRTKTREGTGRQHQAAKSTQVMQT